MNAKEREEHKKKGKITLLRDFKRKADLKAIFHHHMAINFTINLKRAERNLVANTRTTIVMWQRRRIHLHYENSSGGEREEKNSSDSCIERIKKIPQKP